MKNHFYHALSALTNTLVESGCLVETAVHHAIQAVQFDDKKLAKLVVDKDTEVNQRENFIEEECLKILALHQPVAGDLRKIITILKVNNDIERIGDLAVNIAERVLHADYPDDIEAPIDYLVMSEKACTMFKGALDALVYQDPESATAIIHKDDEVDTLHRESFTKVKGFLLKFPMLSGYYMDCLTISRCLERIADLATNICEEVIYLEYGRIVRHRHDTQP